MYQVKKRNGKVVAFDIKKIAAAVEKAFDATETPVNQDTLDFIALKVTADFAGKVKDGIIGIEDIQDSVESVLSKAGYEHVAKAFILYRKQRERMRNASGTLLDYKSVVDKYLKVEDWRVKENSTVTYSIGGLILSNSGAITANYWLSEIYDKEIADAHRNCDFHIHDLSMLSGYCAGWNLKQLIQEGLGGVPGKITSAPASHLSTLCNQMVNFLGIMQNEWAGAQAFSSFDTYLAPFVKKDNLTYKQVKQAIQSFVFGVNTPSRWGCVDQDTEVLSVNGFKKYDELKEGDQIYTWNNGKLELNTVRKVVVKPFAGKLHSYRGRGYDQTVTPTHRMLVKKHNVDEYVIKHSEEVFDCTTPYALPVMLKDSSLPNIDLSDAEIMLAAMVYTDGNIDMRGNNVHKVKIFKSSNRYGGDEIEQILSDIGLEYFKDEKTDGFAPCVVYTMYGDAARYIKDLVGQKGMIGNKFLKMSKRQADLFLRTWSRFDGSAERFRCQFDNEAIADQLQQIAILAGSCSYRFEKKLPSGKTTNYIKIRQVDNVIPKERIEVEYDGLVWCPNVENGTAVFRKNGTVFISGQTQAPFSNITLDWTVPADLKDLPAIVGGKEMDFTYGDCKKEMDMVNKAFIEIMIEGDANGRGFQYPIPTYSITRDFDWSPTENNKLLFEMTAKYGTPYFSNYINSDMEPSDVRSMCCRLRLDLRELRRKSGGFFGSGESTGSIGVVTINMPRLAYLSENEADFYRRLDKLMDLAARSLKIKRDVITKLLDAGLYPYTKHYLGNFNNHFSTIGLVGMNEAGLNANWIRKDMTHKECQDFAKQVLDHMRERLSDYQEQYGDLYNLEATPAESTSYRFAKHDKEDFPNIITAAEAGGNPYYTNSSHLPVSFTDDVFEALDIQDDLQTRYTSGTVFHAFLGEKLPTWESAATLVRKIAENYKLPYYTMSPTYSVCKDHGYLTGEQFICPHCGQSAEVYSRITGYYRPVQNWNDGKAQEYKQRREYTPGGKFRNMEKRNPKEAAQEEPTSECSQDTCLIQAKAEEPTDMTPVLFASATCPNCRMAKAFMDKAGFQYKEILAADNLGLVDKFGIRQAPTLIVPKANGEYEKYAGAGAIKGYLDTLK